MKKKITIMPVRVADLLAEGERMPVYVHVIDHPDGRVLVDTGMTELHPAVADLDPRLLPLSQQDFDLAGIDIVVNTHLHFDHCGGNHLFAGKPIYVQRRELDDARNEHDYTIREWVNALGVRYVPVDGELELLPGLRLVPAPGRAPKASCGCARSTPSWSGSRTSTSRGDPAPSRASLTAREAMLTECRVRRGHCFRKCGERLDEGVGLGRQFSFGRHSRAQTNS